MRRWKQGILMEIMDKIVNKRLANDKIIKTEASIEE